jgi:multidrug efflux system membrane fusion protein
MPVSSTAPHSLPVGTFRRQCALLGALLTTIAVLAACDRAPPAPERPVRAIKTTMVSEVFSGRERRFSGVVEATDSSALSFQVSGNVQAVHVALGERIAQGQVLAVLDDTSYRLDVQAAEAELARSQASLEEKEADYARKKPLVEKGWVSRQAFDQVQAAYESARNGVEYARSRLDLARRNLEHTELRAPFDGVIADKSVEPFMEVGAGQRLFQIDAEGALQVAVDVPETLIGELVEGLPALVRFPGREGLVADGRISEIGKVAGSANAFPVKVGLLDPPEPIRAGMTAEVGLVLGQAGESPAYLVPLSAIAPADAPNTGYVFVYDPISSTVSRRQVTAAGVRGGAVALESGVRPGDVVAVAGVSFLHDGQKVRLLDEGP